MGASRSAPTGERAPTGRGREIGPAGQRDARPLHAQRTGVGLAVGGIVQHGERVVEQVFHAHAEAVEVTPGRRREVGAPPQAVPIDSEAVFAEPGGEHAGAPLVQVERSHVRREIGLRFC